jgi:hypothetical protein
VRVACLAILIAGCGAPATSGDGGGADLLVTGDGGATEAPSRYPAGAVHGPMSRAVVDRLARVVASSTQSRSAFIKVGASNTVNTNFFHCFDGTDIDLGASAALEPARLHFQGWFKRTSLAATVGWGAAKPLEGSPSPLEQEIAAVHPLFAVVLLGTNDTYETGVHPFERNLRRIVEAALAAGVIPILSTIPARTDTAIAAELAPEMNAVIRAIAQARQVPFVDVFGVTDPLPMHGLISDGIHLNVYVAGGAHGCRLTPAGLMFGHNQRNRVSLEALDRVRRFLLDGETPEAAPAPLAGRGTVTDPRVIDALPFVDDGDTTAVTSALAGYACGTQDEGGGEIVYRLDLAAPARLRIRVFSDENADLDLHWLDAADAARCTARADKTLEVQAPAGTSYLVVDTFVSDGAPKAGAYRLTVVAL